MKNTLNVFFTFLIILCSGSLISWIYLKFLLSIMVVTLSLILILNKFKINKKNLLLFMFIIMIFLTNIFINKTYDYNSLIVTVTFFILLFLFQSNCDKDVFVNGYIYLITIISALSLIIFIFVIANLNPLTKIIFTSNTYYTTSFYFVVGQNGSFYNRNAGIFWEPGAFQAFINIAIMFTLFLKNNVNKKVCLSILSITLLTTRSTSGFIAFLIILVMFILNRNMKRKLKITAIISCMLLILIFAIPNVFTDVIISKFSTTNESYVIRNNDFIKTIKIIKEKPLFGYGFMSNEFHHQEILNNIEKNSNGLLITLAMLGCIFLIYYLIMFKNIYYLFNPKGIMKIIISLIFIILLTTEYFTFKPLFITFFYVWNNEEVEGGV